MFLCIVTAVMSEQSILIRPLALDDVEAFNRAVGIVARERRYLRFIDVPPMEMSVSFLKSSLEAQNPHFGAFDGDDLVGWCDICRGSFEVERHGGTLGIGVLPAYRGRGIGRRLIEATIAAADASGFERIALTVRADNIRAATLYERVGFVREGVMRRAVRVDGVDHDVVMMARLKEPAA